MFKSSQFLVLVFKLWAVPSNKTLISFICTCNEVIPNQWGHKAKHGKGTSRPAQALFSPPFPFGCGAGTSTHNIDRPCHALLRKQQNQLPSPPGSQCVSLLMQHLHRQHLTALAPWPHPTHTCSPQASPSPGFREVSPYIILFQI